MSRNSSLLPESILGHSLSLRLEACGKGETLPLLPSSAKASFPSWTSHGRDGGAYFPPLPVGTEVYSERLGYSLCQVSGHLFLPHGPFPHALLCPLLTALHPLTHNEEICVLSPKKGYSLAWLTLSDKGAANKREDTAGPLIASCLQEVLPLCFVQGFLLPDEANQLRTKLTSLALLDSYDIICTTGGTGLTSRDITPDVTNRIIDRTLPGFVQAMMQESLRHTPTAVLSRACCGILGHSLIINLPGSAKAVRENLHPLLPALAHALEKLHDDPRDCAGGDNQ